MAASSSSTHISIQRHLNLPETPLLHSQQQRPSVPRSVSYNSDTLRRRPPALSLRPPSANRDPEMSVGAVTPSGLGPPPAAPLPELPPFPSPIAPGAITTLLRGPTSERRSSQRVHVGNDSSGRSPTSPLQYTPVSDASADAFAPSIRPPSSAHSISSLSRASKSRPISVASFSSHISAASEALGQSILDLDREADALGILTSSSRTGSSRSISKRQGSKRSTTRTPNSITPSQSMPNMTSGGSGSRVGHSSGLRKSSVRMLKPLPNLPSPQEKEESEYPFNNHAVNSRSSSPDIQRILDSTPKNVRSSRSRSRGRSDSLQSSLSKSSLGSRPSQNQLRSSKGSSAREVPPIVTMPNARAPQVPRTPSGGPLRQSTFSNALYDSDEERKSFRGQTERSSKSFVDPEAISRSGTGWMTPESRSGSDSESSIDLHTPLP